MVVIKVARLLALPIHNDILLTMNKLYTPFWINNDKYNDQ